MLPNLLHPVKIIVEVLDIQSTIYDEETREPIKQAIHANAKEVNGQVAWEIKDRDVITEGGARLDSTGYILFRYVDLNSAGITLKLQDRIKKIGWQDVNLYIVSLKPTGHYGDQNGATLVKAYFNDRSPSRSV